MPITILSTDGTSTSCTYPSCDDGEQNLDMTQALGMAPGLASLVMYVGSTDTAIISAMTTHNPLPTTIGCSWGWTPADPTTLNPYFEQMAAQGQNFFAASGDYSTWKASGNSAAWPADNAYVVSVGGTDLVTASAAGPWQSETAWADSGGGISPDKIAIPSWQQLSGVINSSNKGSTTYRNGPDVSANANFTFYTCGDQQACQSNYWGGTSFAAPMWAAYIALVNQQLAINSKPTIGFINPTIYAENVTSSYDSDFHDITSGTSGSYSAVTGFDLVTGWGSPNTGLIAALTGAPQTSKLQPLRLAVIGLSGARWQRKQHDHCNAERRIQFFGCLDGHGAAHRSYGQLQSVNCLRWIREFNHGNLGRGDDRPRYLQHQGVGNFRLHNRNRHSLTHGDWDNSGLFDQRVAHKHQHRQKRLRHRHDQLGGERRL